MALQNSFRFLNNKALNRKLLLRTKAAHIAHEVARDTVYYSPDDEENFGSLVLAGLRSGVFSPWQVLSCPEDWVEKYRAYMRQRKIPYQEEMSNAELCFLIPGQYRPNFWKAV